MRIPLFSAVTEPPLSLLPAHEGEPAFLGGHGSVAFPPAPAESEFDGLRMERRRRDGDAGGRTTATGPSAPRSAMPGASGIAVRPEALRHRERPTAERVHGDFKDSRVRGSRSARPGLPQGGRPAVSPAGSRAPTAGQQGRPQCSSAGREGPLARLSGGAIRDAPVAEELEKRQGKHAGSDDRPNDAARNPLFRGHVLQAFLDSRKSHVNVMHPGPEPRAAGADSADPDGIGPARGRDIPARRVHIPLHSPHFHHGDFAARPSHPPALSITAVASDPRPAPHRTPCPHRHPCEAAFRSPELSPGRQRERRE